MCKGLITKSGQLVQNPLVSTVNEAQGERSFLGM